MNWRVDELTSWRVAERFSWSVNEWAVYNFNDFISGQTGEITGCRRKQIVVYSQTEMDLKSHRCIVSKQKEFLFFCVKVYWCYATHALHSSNNYFPIAILFDYNPTWVWGECQLGLNGSALRPSFTPNRSLEPVQILCVVEYIVDLILESVAGYVERIRQARCRQANERWTGSDGNYLK